MAEPKKKSPPLSTLYPELVTNLSLSAGKELLELLVQIESTYGTSYARALSQALLLYKQERHATPSARRISSRQRSDYLHTNCGEKNLHMGAMPQLGTEELIGALRNLVCKPAVTDHVEQGSSTVQQLPTYRTPKQANAFHREGDVWWISYKGRELHIRHGKGMQYLHYLIERPWRKIYVLQLLQQFEREKVQVDLPQYLRLTGNNAAGAVPFLTLPELIIDSKSKRKTGISQCKREWLLSQMDQWRRSVLADHMALIDRVEEYRQQVSRVSQEEERARINITRTIRSAIGRIRKLDNDLARHFACINTGRYLSYEPNAEIENLWNMEVRHTTPSGTALSIVPGKCSNGER
ncbi:hypothetical protein OAO01_01450 [Oligoflexia bacterium]|nr:hypothetical protein [Oligoflexia bacterium]